MPGTIRDPDDITAAAEAATRQNRINSIWEYTQAGIAVSIVLANILVVFIAVTSTPEQQSQLRYAFFLVIGFYFGRTNHARPINKDAGGTK